MLKGQLATAADARIDKTPLGHVSDIMDVPCYAKMVIFVLLVLHGQYLDCWWPDDAGRQGTVLLSKTPYDKISQTQWAHDAVITSLWRQNDVVTSFWRHDDVIITPFVRWEAPRSVVSSPIALNFGRGIGSSAAEAPANFHGDMKRFNMRIRDFANVMFSNIESGPWASAVMDGGIIGILIL